MIYNEPLSYGNPCFKILKLSKNNQLDKPINKTIQYYLFLNVIPMFLEFSELQITEERRILWDNIAIFFFIILSAKHSLTGKKNK